MGGGGGGGGGGGPPGLTTEWKPGKPYPSDDLHQVIKQLSKELNSIIYKIRKSGTNWIYDLVCLENNIQIQVNRKVLEAKVFVNRKLIGRYSLDEPGSIENAVKDIGKKIVVAEEPTKEGVHRTKKVVLVSGGLDSTLLALVNERDEKIYFDYGQKFRDIELESLCSMKIFPRIIKIEKQQIDENGIFKSRNLKFFLTLREEYPDDDLVAYFGNNFSDENPKLITDNCQYSIRSTSKTINLMYAGPKFLIESPLFYQKIDKKTISECLLKIAPSNGFVVWCEDSDFSPCGLCHKCKQMKDIGIFDLWFNRLKNCKLNAGIVEIANSID